MIMPHKNKFGRDKKNPKNKKHFNLKRGRNRQIKGMNFSSKTDC